MNVLKIPTGAPSAHLATLNSQQVEAVLASSGPALVLAGVGSGKTRVIVHRILHLLSEGNPPGAILALTFTNKAAGEMRVRLKAALGFQSPGIWLGTFHSIGARILRAEHERVGLPRDFIIMNRGECLAFLKREMKKDGLSFERYPPKYILELVGRIKTSWAASSGETLPESSFTHSAEAVAARLAPRYGKSHRAVGALDFDDLLALPLRLFMDHPDVLARYRRQFAEILVDEYQDTNAVQNRMVRMLGGEEGRVFAVGDDDQSIYRWRGAEVHNIQRFEAEFSGARVFRLEENYRSSGRILAAAAAVMRFARGRREKNLFTNNPTGEPVAYFSGADPSVEAQMIFQRLAKVEAGGLIPWGEMAIFYRTNTQSRPLEEEARRRKIPYQVVKGQRFFDRTEVQDLSAYLRVFLNPGDATAFTRIVNRPPRGLGPAKLLAISGGGEDVLVSVDAARNALVSGRITGAAGRSLDELLDLIESLSKKRMGPAGLIEEILGQTGYRRWLEEISHKSASPERRLLAVRGLEGISEFGAAALACEERVQEEQGLMPEEPEAIACFLEDMALSAEADELEENGGRLSLMTLHAAKGLEFRAVAIAGVQDGLIPHIRSVDDTESLDEERRLLYVGMTRAKELLMLSWALERRSENGSGSWISHPSRFLESLGNNLIHVEMPSEAMQFNSSRMQRRGGRVAGPACGREGEQSESKIPEKLLGPFVPGVWVVHAKFGEGLITSRSGVGDRAVVTVKFESVGAKKLVIKHASLTLVEDNVDGRETPNV